MLTIPGRIPIRIYPLFFMVMGILSFYQSNFQVAGAVIWMLVIFISVLVHEFGHALTALAFGQRASIDLVGFGGATRHFGKQLNPFQEFLIVINGPIAGFMLFVVSYILLANFGASFPQLMRSGLFILAYANLFWTLLNLLPIHPLDGGQLLRIALEGIFGLPGLKIALFISFLFGLLLSIFLLIKMPLLGIFLLLFSFESFWAWKSTLSKTVSDDDKALQQFFKGAERDFHKGHLDYAQEKINVVRKQSQSGKLYMSATTLLAQILYMQGHSDKAYQLLSDIKKKLSPEGELLFHQLAYAEQKWQEAIEVGNHVFQYKPTYEVALVNAFCHAALNQARAAIGWLNCATKSGLPNLAEVLKRNEFNTIREDPDFLALMHKYGK